MWKLVACSLVFTAIAACQTQFYGSPSFPHGPGGCQRTCEAVGMKMGAFVYSGQFATSCVCAMKSNAIGAATREEVDAAVIAEAEAAASATAAAWWQRQQQQQASYGR